MINIVWVDSPDLKNLPNTTKEGNITLQELDLLVDMIAKNCASRLKLTSDIVLSMMQTKNSDFYSTKNSIFKNGTEVLQCDSDEFKSLCEYFKIPVSEERSNYMAKTYLAGVSLSETPKKAETDAKNLKNLKEISEDRINEVLNSFYELSSLEQIVFIRSLSSNFTVNLSVNDILNLF